MAMSWVYSVLSYCLIKPRHIPWQYFCLNFVWIFTLSFLKIPVLSKALQSRSHDIFFGKFFLFHRPYRSQGKLHSHFFLCLSILPLRQHFAKYIQHFHIFRKDTAAQGIPDIIHSLAKCFLRRDTARDPQGILIELLVIVHFVDSLILRFSHAQHTDIS